MQSTLGFYVGLLRLSRIAIAAQKLGLAIHENAGKKFSRTLIFYDPKHSQFVLMMCPPLILLVNGMRNIPQVANAVI
ncbi:hypothetical protein, partial [Pseudomonas aeruginosa]|uniref:hypothetical protein n=1 Tax=Pseudomonas aeruginosa TaxID=287 RepID=UPI003D27DBBD